VRLKRVGVPKRMESRPRWLGMGALAMTVLGLVNAPAFGAEVSYFYGYRGEFSDNIQRVATNPQHDMVNVVVAGLSYQDRSRTLEMRLAPSVEFIDYRKNSFADETRLNLDSLLLWTLSPQRLTWTAEDAVRQVRIDPTQPDTPTNTAVANFFSTGPDIYLRAGSVNTLQLGGRYGDVYVSDTNLDNQRTLYYGRWLYQTSPLTTLSLNYETEAVDFDDKLSNVNFQRRDAFFRIQTRTSQSDFSLDAGKSTISRDGTSDAEATLARLSWNRRLNAESTFGVAAESSLSDTGSDLASTAASANNPGQGTTGSVSQNLVTQDIFRAKRGEISYSRFSSRLKTNFRVFARSLEFQATPTNDRDEAGGEVSIGYFYSSAMSIDLFYSRVRADYRNQTLVDADSTVGLGVTRLITRNVSTVLRVQQDQRESTNATREFVDNRIIFSVTYSSGLLPRR